MYYKGALKTNALSLYMFWYLTAENQNKWRQVFGDLKKVSSQRWVCFNYNLIIFSGLDLLRPTCSVKG